MQVTGPAIDTDILAKRLDAMLRGGRIGAARPLMRALQRLEPPSPWLSELEARLLVAEGHVTEALAALDLAITAAPDHAGLRKCRAGVHVDLGDIPAAADDAAQAVILDPADPAAKKMLGVLLVTLDRGADAIACLSEALAAEPGHASHYRGLAMAQDRVGDPRAAAITLALGIAACPNDVKLRESAILLALRERRFTEAVDLAEKARRDGRTSATCFALLGHALASLGRHAAAADAYGEALKLAPGDPQIRQLAAISGLHRDGSRAPVTQVRSIFDFYAEHFEQHAISLRYRIPGVVRGILAEYLPPADPAAGDRPALLDLGCGTGLIAVVASDMVGPITGVDISPAMLASARAKNLYAELVEADLTGWLAQESRSWPVIVAADVLIYFGDLAEALGLARARLAPGGLFVFSLEEKLAAIGDSAAADDGTDGWQLGRMGRFAHSRAYVERVLADTGFTVRRLEPQVQRLEAGADVRGWIVVAQCPS